MHTIIPQLISFNMKQKPAVVILNAGVASVAVVLDFNTSGGQQKNIRHT